MGTQERVQLSSQPGNSFKEKIASVSYMLIIKIFSIFHTHTLVEGILHNCLYSYVCAGICTFQRSSCWWLISVISNPNPARQRHGVTCNSFDVGMRPLSFVFLFWKKIWCSKPEPDFSSITPQTIRARVAPRDSMRVETSKSTVPTNPRHSQPFGIKAARSPSSCGMAGVWN